MKQERQSTISMDFVKKKIHSSRSNYKKYYDQKHRVKEVMLQVGEYVKVMDPMKKEMDCSTFIGPFEVLELLNIFAKFSYWKVWHFSKPARYRKCVGSKKPENEVTCRGGRRP